MKMRTNPEFRLEAQFVVAKTIRHGGRLLEAGEVFHWRPLGINKRRLRQLFDAKKIMYADDMLNRNLPANVRRAIEVQAAADAEVLPTETPLDSVTYSIELSSPGWFNVVDSNGNRVNEKSLREEAANELLERVTTENS